MFNMNLLVRTIVLNLPVLIITNLYIFYFETVNRDVILFTPTQTELAPNFEAFTLEG